MIIKREKSDMWSGGPAKDSTFVPGRREKL
jgi:hypothetical protein